MWRYRIATEIEKSVFSQLFFLVAMYRHIEKSVFFQLFFLVAMCGDTVSPQKLKNLVFFNFFFGWRCVAIPYRHRN